MAPLYISDILCNQAYFGGFRSACALPLRIKDTSKLINAQARLPTSNFPVVCRNDTEHVRLKSQHAYSLPRSNGTAKIKSGFPIRNFIALGFLNILWAATLNTNII